MQFHCLYKNKSSLLLFSQYCPGLYSSGDDTTFSCCMQCQTAVRYFLFPCSKLVLGYENLRITHLIKIDPECISDSRVFVWWQKFWMGGLLIKEHWCCSFTIWVKTDNSFSGVPLLNQRCYYVWINLVSHCYTKCLGSRWLQKIVYHLWAQVRTSQISILWIPKRFSTTQDQFLLLWSHIENKQQKRELSGWPLNLQVESYQVVP